ncbi:MAG: MerR family transcriptional regulator [Muribaculaceae bacterium]|nr:MerR family transcriptional regulator [Muribaculaceae bacterium]
MTLGGGSMTIKELENRTGMTRANIRFYEGEGLLTPRRLDNGYRDYSEEDAETLKKIKLLRQLQLDIDTIRKVQGGALTLEQALFVQTTKLEGDKAVIERAAEVCRELQQTSVEYAALEPQPWLYRLEAPQRPSLPEAPPAVLEDGAEDEEDDEPQACYCPWQRYFARALDMSLYGTVSGVVWTLWFWDQSVILPKGLISWLLGLALLGFTLAAEPLWLHFLGWTPGKLLFGLKLRDEDGGKLSLVQGWERSWRVFQDGYGWNIPFWDLYKMWQWRKLGLDGRDCWWDGSEDYRYTKVERRFSAGVVYVLVMLVCIGARWSVIQLTDLPVNRGDLTVEEFSENYNLFHDRYENLGVGNVPKLGVRGLWVKEAGSTESGRVIHGSRSIVAEDGTTYTIENPVEGTAVWSQPEFTLEDGRITAVTLRVKSWDSIIYPERLREALALMAMSGAADGQDILHFDAADGLLMMLNLQFLEDQELDYWGLHISQQVDYEGYEPPYGGSLWAVEGASRYFEKTLTISLMEG